MRTVGLLVSLLLIGGLWSMQASAAPKHVPFKVEAAFAGGKPIDAKHSCDGADLSPALRWGGAPARTKIFVIVVVDPDAPSGNFFHWLIWNIPASASGVPENVPKALTLATGAVQGTNDFGQPGWGGPCPPKGATHRYQFRVYALDARLDLAAGAKAADVLRAVRGHVVGQGEVIGTFSH